MQAPADLDPAVLVAQVEAAGYTATLPAPPATDDAAIAEPDPTRRCATGSSSASCSRVPVIALAMVPAAAVHLLAVDLAHARRARRGVGGVAVPPRGVDEPAPRRRRPWTRSSRWACWRRSAGRCRRWCSARPASRAWCTRSRSPSARRRGGGRSTSRSPRASRRSCWPGRYFEARSKRRAGAALRALLELGRQGRRGAARTARPRAADPDRPARGRRPVRRAARREDRDGRGRRGGPLGRRRRAAHRRVRAGRRRAGRRGGRRDRNAGGRLVVRATRVGADTQLAQMAELVEDAQTGKAPVQRLADRISGVFVPIVIALAVATLGVLARHRRGRRRGVHRRRRGADHRLPVRARPGDADGAARRHRPRRPAGHPDQGPGGAGGDPAGRHGRARQDRHGDDRPDGAGRGARRPTATTQDEVLRLAGAVEAASEHPIAAAIADAAAARVGELPAGRGLRERRGPRRAGRRRRPRRAGRPPGAARAGGASRCRRRSAAALADAPRRAGAPRWRWRGTARPGRRSSSPTPSSRRRPRRSPGCARSACARCC